MWVPWSVTSTSLICDVSSLIYDAKPTVLGFRVWGQGLSPTVRNRTVRPIRPFRPSEPYHWTFNSCFVFKFILVQGLMIPERAHELQPLVVATAAWMVSYHMHKWTCLDNTNWDLLANLRLWYVAAATCCCSCWTRAAWLALCSCCCLSLAVLAV